MDAKMIELEQQLALCIDAIRDENEGAVPVQSIQALLLHAAQLTESCAFMLARQAKTGPVTELILMANRLEYVAKDKLSLPDGLAKGGRCCED